MKNRIAEKKITHNNKQALFDFVKLLLGNNSVLKLFGIVFYLEKTVKY